MYSGVRTPPMRPMSWYAGQPEHAGRRAIILFRLDNAKRLANAFEVVQQVARAKPSRPSDRWSSRRCTAGTPGRPFDRGPLPHIGQFVVQLIGRDPLVRRGVGREQFGVERGECLSGRQRDVGIAVDGDSLQPRHRPLRFGIRGRHRDNASVHTTEERGNELKAGRINEQGTDRRA